jgi:hypothetical protein
MAVAEKSRAPYFEAHAVVAEASVALRIQTRKVAALRRQLAHEQAILAVMDLEVQDLLDSEDYERARLR